MNELENTLLTQKIRYAVLAELEAKIEKYLKNEFYNKMLPKLISEVKDKVIVDLVNYDDRFELSVKIKDDF